MCRTRPSGSWRSVAVRDPVTPHEPVLDVIGVGVGAVRGQVAVRVVREARGAGAGELVEAVDGIDAGDGIGTGPGDVVVRRGALRHLRGEVVGERGRRVADAPREALALRVQPPERVPDRAGPLDRLRHRRRGGRGPGDDLHRPGRRADRQPVAQAALRREVRRHQHPAVGPRERRVEDHLRPHPVAARAAGGAVADCRPGRLPGRRAGPGRLGRRRPPAGRLRVRDAAGPPLRRGGGVRGRARRGRRAVVRRPGLQPPGAPARSSCSWAR